MFNNKSLLQKGDFFVFHAFCNLHFVTAFA